MQLIIFEEDEDIELFLNRKKFQNFFNMLRTDGKFKEIYVKSRNGACSSLEPSNKWDIFEGGSIKKDNLKLSKLSIRQLVKLGELCNYSLPYMECDKYSLLKSKLKEVIFHESKEKSNFRIAWDKCICKYCNEAYVFPLKDNVCNKCFPIISEAKKEELSWIEGLILKHNNCTDYHCIGGDKSTCLGMILFRIKEKLNMRLGD